MRDITPEIHEAGAELVIIGNGSAQFAQGFVEDYDVTTPVFTNPGREVYDAVGAGRGRFRHLFSRQLLRNTRRARGRGYRQHEVLGDARQLGGVFVVLTSGAVPYAYRSGVAGDHPEPQDVLAALRAAVEPNTSG